jgi:ubiquitin C-terminal hydrolase
LTTKKAFEGIPGMGGIFKTASIVALVSILYSAVSVRGAEVWNPLDLGELMPDYDVLFLPTREDELAHMVKSTQPARTTKEKSTAKKSQTKKIRSARAKIAQTRRVRKPVARKVVSQTKKIRSARARIAQTRRVQKPAAGRAVPERKVLSKTMEFEDEEESAQSHVVQLPEAVRPLPSAQPSTQPSTVRPLPPTQSSTQPSTARPLPPTQPSTQPSTAWPLPPAQSSTQPSTARPLLPTQSSTQPSTVRPLPPTQPFTMVPAQLPGVGQSLPKGLKNDSSSCYFNSVMQLLYALPEVRYYFIGQKNGSPLADNVKKIFTILNSPGPMNNGQKDEVEVCKRYILDELNRDADALSVLSPDAQCDAPEFLERLINRLKNNGEQITKCFEFNLRDITRSKDDPSNILQMVTPETVLRLNFANRFEEMFLDFCKQEDMDGLINVNGLYVEAVKFARIANPPQFLMIQVKRFVHNPGTNRTDKIENSMVVVDEFTIPPAMIGGASRGAVKYKLVGGIVHFGSDPRSGHYVTYAEFEESDGAPVSFMEFDDARVRSISKDSMLKSLGLAYVLLYRLEH